MVGCQYDRYSLKRPIGQYRSSVNFPDSKSAQIVCNKLGNISLISNLHSCNTNSTASIWFLYALSNSSLKNLNKFVKFVVYINIHMVD